MATINASQAMVLVSRQNGIVVIPSTPLTRLNYFGLLAPVGAAVEPGQWARRRTWV
jgi:hypothetical protein